MSEHILLKLIHLSANAYLWIWWICCRRRTSGAVSFASFCKNSIWNIMNCISKAAELWVIYTNYWGRETVVTNLEDTGMKSTDLLPWQDVKNINSVDSYVRRSREEKKFLKYFRHTLLIASHQTYVRRVIF